MEAAAPHAFPLRRPVVLAILVTLTILGFMIVGHLVSGYRVRQKQLAQKLYRRGVNAQRAGNPDRALEDFRAALTYDPDNDQLQLSLGRALRDTGRLDEAEAYLLTLWERTPQDSTINLALGRLAARRGDVQEALRYYHNAIYGVWKSDAEANRRMARLELIEFLLQQNALAEAQSELLALVPTLPRDPQLHVRVAQLFARAQDYAHALSQYQAALKEDRDEPTAMLGAGQAAFQLGRYRTAQTFLHSAAADATAESTAKPLLDTANLILASDPYRRGISDAERNRRIRSAFDFAGERLNKCVLSRGVDLNGTPSANDLASLKAEWTAMKPKLRYMNRQFESDLPDQAMDLVFRIEQQTEKDCGPPEGADLALLLISRDRAGVDR